MEPQLRADQPMELDLEALQVLPEAAPRVGLRPIGPTTCARPTCVMTTSPGTTIIG